MKERFPQKIFSNVGKSVEFSKTIFCHSCKGWSRLFTVSSECWFTTGLLEGIASLHEFLFLQSCTIQWPTACQCRQPCSTVCPMRPAWAQCLMASALPRAMLDLKFRRIMFACTGRGQQTLHVSCRVSILYAIAITFRG